MLSMVFLLTVEPSSKVCVDSISATAVSGTFGTGVTNTPATRVSTPRYAGGVVRVAASCAKAEPAAGPNATTSASAAKPHAAIITKAGNRTEKPQEQPREAFRSMI